MFKSYEFSLEVWPGVVRVHQGEDTEFAQVIELSPSQIELFCEALRAVAKDAKELGDEFDKREAEIRTAKALKNASRGE